MEDNNVHPQARGVSAINVVLLILMLATLGGVGYVAWMTQVQSDVMAERTTGTEAEVAQLRSELAESERMLAEEKARVPAPEYDALLEDKIRGYRVVVAPGCKEIYKVTPQSPGADYTALWHLALTRNPSTGIDGRFILMTQDQFRAFSRQRAEAEVGGGVLDEVVATKDNMVFVQESGGGDFGADVLTAPDGKLCGWPITHRLP